MMEEEGLTTLHAWQRALRLGADYRVLLRQRLRRLRAESPAHVWIRWVTDAELETQLQALDAAVASLADPKAVSQTLPFLGVPFAVKDNIDIAGVPTTAACPAYERVATVTSTAVQRLMQAGAVWLGKTNLDQFATGLVGTRSPYGRPASTFDATRISGGSSSGSAVAVSRRDVVFALGTDTAGSGRVPAGLNNVVGLKPTPGRVSIAGVVPACRSLDCVAVFALDVADASAVLAVIEGPDPADAYSHHVPGPSVLPRRLRVGVPAVPVFHGDTGQAEAWAAALARLEALGHSVVPLDFEPLHAVARLLYEGPWVAERHAVVQPLLEAQAAALDPTVRSVIETATRFSATDAFRAQYRLKEAQAELAGTWKHVDLLMVPTTTGHPTFAEIDADPVGANSRMGVYTNFVNLLGWCAMAMPSGLTASGLPFGVTFIGPAAHDVALADYCVTWQRATPLPPGAPVAARAAVAVSPAATSPGTLPLSVVGAHLRGLPLNHQLLERGATFRCATETAPCYRLYALPGTTPPKPGLRRVTHGGAAIAVEVWDVPIDQVGAFLALIPAPLALGSQCLADGSTVHGFLCEEHALEGAIDITAFGGWAAYLQSLKPQASPSAAAPA